MAPTLEEGLGTLGESLRDDVQRAKADLVVTMYSLASSRGKPWSTPRKSGFMAASLWPSGHASAVSLTKSTGVLFETFGSAGVHRSRVRRELKGGSGPAFLHCTADYASDIEAKRGTIRRAAEEALARFKS